jgi:predicted TIM-barrel fold metal-dependent hydrolase
MSEVSRRALLGAAAAGAAMSRLLAARPQGYLVETAIHLWAADQNRFPYHPNATYRPAPLPLEMYAAFVRESKLDHTVIVHSEVYQDDHRYLEYCFEHEPSPGFFKGTCLFDPIDPRTPDRMQELVRRLPNRIVGIRIHEMHARGTPSTTSGPMRDRDMRSAGMKNTWRKAHELGLAVQMQCIPCYAPQVAALASEFRDMPVLIDHLGLPARGTAAEFEEVINTSKLPHVYMKVSSLNAVPNVQPLVRRLYDAFGPDRLIWGGYGMSMPAFVEATALIDRTFDFAPESDRDKVRGLNAMRVFGFH